VFPSALSIPLPGNHGAACAFAPNIAGREAQVNQCQTVFDTFRLVFDTARMKRD
jgi:hypothetical protein